MELPVLFQAEQFAQAVLLGGLLGLVYDLLRAPRRFLPKLAGVLDALFLLALLLSLLFFALYAGQGQFRLFAVENCFIPQCGVEHGYQLFHADHDSIIKTVLGESLH